MYKIDVEKYANLLTWQSIYWGIENQLIEPVNAILFANKIVEDNPEIDIPEIIQLLIADEQDTDGILELINKIVLRDYVIINENHAMKVIRYVILSEVQRNATSNREILEKIEGIYADLGYPADMESFISYMPVRDDGYNVEEHTPKENEKRLINNFEKFIADEYKCLKQ